MALKATLWIAIGCVLVATPARATLNPPAAAKSMVLSMVRGYDTCVFSDTQHNPTPFPIPACTSASTSPQQPTVNAFEWGPKGVGTIKVGLAKGPDIKFGAVIKDVRDSATHLPTSNSIYVTAGIRVTDTNCQVGVGIPCTQVNVTPGVYSVAIPCVNGTCKGAATLNTSFAGLVSAGSKSNVEILTIQVVDSLGHVFLTPGLYVP